MSQRKIHASRRRPAIHAEAPHTCADSWGPWRELDPAEATAHFGTPVERATVNDRLVAIQRTVPSGLFIDEAGAGTTMTHLMVAMKDGVEAPWATLQRVKDELCGADREAVELYPSARRAMDVTERHLWVLPAGAAWPLGMIPSRPAPAVEAPEAAPAPLADGVPSEPPPAPETAPTADAAAEALATALTDRLVADELARLGAQWVG